MSVSADLTDFIYAQHSWSGILGYQIAGDEAYLEPAALHKLAGQPAQSRQLSRDNALQQHSLEVVLPLVDERPALRQGTSFRREMKAEPALTDVFKRLEKS